MELRPRLGVCSIMLRRLACTGTLLLLGGLGQARATTADQAMVEARRVLAQPTSTQRLDEDRLVALAFHLAGGCPATLDGEKDSQVRDERKRIIAALIDVVAESGTKRGLTKLLQLDKCGVASPAWGRQRILERAMARMMAFVPCTPPLPGEVAAAREELADFPILRLRQGALRAELPTEPELDDLAYFLIAVAQAGEEVGARSAGAFWQTAGPAHAMRAELFRELANAKSAGHVADIERLARTYLETLGFPDTLHGGEEDVFFGHTPRYHHVMIDLAESWESLGRFHEAAGLWRRTHRGAPAAMPAGDHAWTEQVKAVIRDEEIGGRCELAVAERLLAVGEPYGPKRLERAGFDVARLYRGALLTRNRDAGEPAVAKAIEAWPATPRLFAQMRMRDKGVEDWERRLQATRGLADTMQEAAIPLLLRAAAESLPAGRRRAITALGDLAARPPFDPCRALVSAIHSSTDWQRPVSALGSTCRDRFGNADRGRLATAMRDYANDHDVATRQALAVALGKLAVPATVPTLRRLLASSETAALARAALDHVAEVERNWHETK